MTISELGAQLDKVFESAAAPYQVASQHAQRHGSWEWVAQSRHELDRYVILAVTDLDAPDNPLDTVVRIEVWAGAEESARYCRHLVTKIDTQLAKLTKTDLFKELGEPIQSGVKLAESFTQSSLVDSRDIRPAKAG